MLMKARCYGHTGARDYSVFGAMPAALAPAPAAAFEALLNLRAELPEDGVDELVGPTRLDQQRGLAISE